MTLLVLTQGAGAIWHGMATLGWGGFAAVVVFHMVLIALMGLAWWLLGRDRGGWPQFIWGRLIRDSASEALPLSQIGGYVLGARAVALTGLSSAFAAGSTVVDVTVELVAQLGYTLVGLALLSRLRPHSEIVVPLLTGVALMAVLVMLFIAVQARGAGAVERIAAKVARQLLGRDIAQSGAVKTEIQHLHARRGRLLLAASVHFTTWMLSGVETWLTLRLMGIPISVAAGVVDRQPAVRDAQRRLHGAERGRRAGGGIDLPVRSVRDRSGHGVGIVAAEARAGSGDWHSGSAGLAGDRGPARVGAARGRFQR